jgi:hypothetical protein
MCSRSACRKARPRPSRNSRRRPSAHNGCATGNRALVGTVESDDGEAAPSRLKEGADESGSARGFRHCPSRHRHGADGSGLARRAAAWTCRRRAHGAAADPASPAPWLLAPLVRSVFALFLAGDRAADDRSRSNPRSIVSRAQQRVGAARCAADADAGFARHGEPRRARLGLVAAGDPLGRSRQAGALAASVANPKFAISRGHVFQHERISRMVLRVAFRIRNPSGRPAIVWSS